MTEHVPSPTGACPPPREALRLAAPAARCERRLGLQRGRRPARVLFLLALVLCAAPRSARADAVGDLLAGIRAYDEGELERASHRLRAAIKALARPTERARAHLYLGLCAAARKDAPATERAFAEALAADPELEPPRERIPPPLLARFDAVRARLRGELAIDSTELGAQVFIDDRLVGAAPLRLSLSVGRHAVRVLSQDRLRQEVRTLVVRPGAETKLAARPQPRLGRLALAVSPHGAEVFLGRELVAKSPSPPVPVVAGRQRFLVRAKGHGDAARWLEVPPDGLAELRVALSPRPPWWKRRRPWGLVGLGLGVALAAGGLVYGKSASDAADEARAGLAARTLSRGAYDALSAEASARSLRANVLLGLGAAVGAAGLGLVLWGDGKDDADARARLSLRAVGPGLALTGTFR